MNSSWLPLVSSCLALILLGCQDTSQFPVLTALSQCVGLGGQVTLAGRVAGFTFDNHNQGTESVPKYELRDERFYLLNGILLETPPCHEGRIMEPGPWGLGIKLSPDFLGDDTRSAVEGDEIRVKGRFGMLMRNNTAFPILDEVTHYEVVSTPQDSPSPGLAGEPCVSDMACDDRLICDREASVCSPTPFDIRWESGWHDIHGACDTDADCPVGQFCHLEYTIESADGLVMDSIWEGDLGRHICIPEEEASLDSLCPEIGTSLDLAGGRYVTGKEICVRGRVFLVLDANFGKTHVQLYIDDVEILPPATYSYQSFGATTEIDYLYKDSLLGGHVVNLPEVGQNIIVLGTSRFDNDHGWFEIHPMKVWWPDD